jgi:hypothetical protein
MPPAEVRLTESTIDFLEQKMRTAVSDGIKTAMTDEAAEKFWSTGLAVLQRQATQKTGQLVGGAVLGLAKKAMLFMVLGALVYSIGGWTALAALWKAATSATP